MKYLKNFNENLDLKDVKFVERPLQLIYKEPSISRSFVCMYKNADISKLDFAIFTELIHTRELRGIFKNEIYIQHLITNKEYQRNGIANALLKKLIEYAKEIGIEVITLKYDMFVEDVEALKRQYEKVGFKILNANKMILALVPGRWN